MTESVFATRAEAEQLFSALQAQPMEFVDVLGGGKAALEKANKQWGLALAEDEISILVNAGFNGLKQPYRCGVDDVRPGELGTAATKSSTPTSPSTVWRKTNRCSA